MKNLWNKISTFAKKNGERAAIVFVTAFSASFVLPALTDLGNPVAWKSVVYSGAAAGLSAVLGLFTKNVGPDKDSPATQ